MILIECWIRKQVLIDSGNVWIQSIALTIVVYPGGFSDLVRVLYSGKKNMPLFLDIHTDMCSLLSNISQEKSRQYDKKVRLTKDAVRGAKVHYILGHFVLLLFCLHMALKIIKPDF